MSDITETVILSNGDSVGFCKQNDGRDEERKLYLIELFEARLALNIFEMKIQASYNQTPALIAQYRLLEDKYYDLRDKRF